MAIRIANAQAFWGDDSSAAARLAESDIDLDWITLDYLAEVSMSILARQRERDASAGYARDFLEVVESLTPFWKRGRRLKVVSNAGGLNPQGCAEACAKVLERAGCHGMRIGIVSGDDVLEQLKREPGNFGHLEDGRSLDAVAEQLVTANAYLGAGPVARAIGDGADSIITGRVADPSLTVAPCVAHFGWSATDYDRIAGATVAGHLIECGTQVTGGISTDWMEIADAGHIGFPIAEVGDDGACVMTKARNSGGKVNDRTVKEQLVYEIGDPGAYLSPDATVSFLTLGVRDEGNDRVSINGATGKAPTEFYKVSATYRAGYRASGMLTIFGRDAVAKARRCGEIVRERLREGGSEPEHYLAECLGTAAAAPGVLRADYSGIMETVLRISVSDKRREVVEKFTRAVMPLIASGPQGTTGYSQGRPVVHDVFGYWPTLIRRSAVEPLVRMIRVS